MAAREVESCPVETGHNIEAAVRLHKTCRIGSPPRAVPDQLIDILDLHPVLSAPPAIGPNDQLRLWVLLFDVEVDDAADFLQN